jgi:hypothetical protein
MPARSRTDSGSSARSVYRLEGQASATWPCAGAIDSQRFRNRSRKRRLRRQRLSSRMTIARSSWKAAPPLRKQSIVATRRPPTEIRASLWYRAYGSSFADGRIAVETAYPLINDR